MTDATFSHLRSGEPDSTLGKAKTDFLPLSGWLVTFSVFFMFLGMMHDFDLAGISELDFHNRSIDSITKFERDVNDAKIERKLSFVLSAVISAYCFFTAKRLVAWESSTVLYLVLIGLGWIFASLTWSVDPGLTARALVRIGVFAFFAYSVSIRFTVNEFCKILLIVSLLSILFSVMFEIFVGAPIADDNKYRLSGSLHSNIIARFAMLIAFFSATHISKDLTKSRLWIILLVLALSVIQLARSRTGLAAALAGLATVFLIGQTVRTLTFSIILGLFSLGMGVAVLGIVGDSGFSALGDAATMGRAEDVSSLTGRLPLWELLLEIARPYSWTGPGYGAFWNNSVIVTIFDKEGWYVAHAHNSFIEVYINTGLVGVIILCMLGISALLRAIQLSIRYGQFGYVVFAATLVAAFVNGIAESGFVLPRELAIVSLTICFFIAQAPNENQSLMLGVIHITDVAKTTLPEQ